ncbi:hypothetical protein M408DRAFT_24635 [Serendipita vermifera MAFF 305830]|uniref:Uncharacterized protein n=1 Tax=Serendipita vermifera MAFF 305830 TaxID=933852 RepID=A0A0C2WMB9_SERVB|nr:hypothetical protein M408DRAFT_24635 [Serendipita vermifera MAFF 305830]
MIDPTFGCSALTHLVLNLFTGEPGHRWHYTAAHASSAAPPHLNPPIRPHCAGGPDTIETLGLIRVGPRLAILDIHPCETDASVTRYLERYLVSTTLTHLDYSHCCQTLLDVRLLPKVLELGLVGIINVDLIVDILRDDTLPEIHTPAFVWKQFAIVRRVPRTFVQHKFAIRLGAVVGFRLL